MDATPRTEWSYAVPGPHWEQHRQETIEAARALAAEQGVDLDDADPEVHVVVVFAKKETAGQLAAATR
ncbi:hypothetical protein K1W54_29760 [Micromonospora sp. CPCC 205371]|nr:hypothetical protein [Micromonospora sp. CPCC 205371]